MTTIHVLVEIKVDEETIADKYPNFELNYGGVDTFILMLQHDLETSDFDDGVLIDHLQEKGYSIRLVSREEGKLIEVEEQEREEEEDCDATESDTY